MARGKIMADTVNALCPGWDGHDPDKAFVLWDDKLAGFGVKVTPKGAKIYVFQYRLGGRGHDTKRYTIGAEGNPYRPNSARQKAEELSRRVKDGEDVVAKAKEKKRIAVDLAFSPYVRTFADSTLKRHWPKSWRQTKRCLELHASKHLGDKPLPDVTAGDVRGLLKRLDDQPATKRNLFAALSYLFGKSVKDGVIAASPLAGMEAPPQVEERSRTLNDDELRWLWNAAGEEAPTYCEVVRHLIQWGQRRSETAGLPWAELSRQRAEWHLPAARAKNGCETLIPLTDWAIADLDRIAGGERWPRKGLVFPSSKGTALSGFSKMKRRLDDRMTAEAKEAGAELGAWTLHDLRRTLATYMQRLAVPYEVIEHLLNHKERSRTGIGKVYQTHDFKPEKRAALERWEAELGRIIKGGEAVVIPLRRPA